ncbi:MAG TPA: DUF4097 family beta strand repeat-containing protein [Thermoanaerobaculia bacterium]
MRNVFAAALLLSASIALGDDQITHAFSASASRGGASRVVIDVPAGDVKIRSGAASAIRITGFVRRNYDGNNERNKQQRIANDITVGIDVHGDEAVISRKYGPSANSWSARSWHSTYDMSVEVPRGVDLDIRTKYGDVTLDGDFGNVDVDLTAGEIHLTVPRSSVRELNASVRVGEVHTDTGDLHEDHEGLFPGRTRFYNATGRSTINVHTTFGEVHVTLTK